MRIDYDYIGKVLNIFLESSSATVDWNSFKTLRLHESDEKFIFHIEIMVDKNLVVGVNKNKSIGIQKNSSNYTVSIVPWRLTSEGHDFANAITKPDILSIVKDKFKTEGFSIVINMAKQIAIKKTEKILGL